MATPSNNSNTFMGQSELPESRQRQCRDKVTEQRLQQLHPKVRDVFRNFICDCEAMDKDTTLRIVQGLRTFEEQASIYAQGRTTAGKIVSNAKAGQSFHNYGLAIDLVELDGEHNEIADWNFDMGKLKSVADKYGITWGGDFRSIKDKPHFEKTYGFSWAQLLALHNAGKVDKNGYVLM